MRIPPLANPIGIGPLIDPEDGPAAGSASRRTDEPDNSAAAGSSGDRVGARLGRARTSRGLSVAEVSSRTYIRPSVLHRMEEDDFAACGGDCYARGQLRMLAGVLQMDERGLLAAFDQQERSLEPGLVPDDETARSIGRRGWSSFNAGIWLGLLMLAVLAGLLMARIVP